MNGNRGGLTGIGSGHGQHDTPRTRFKNTAGEFMPPYAVMKVTGTDSNNKHQLIAVKPNGTASNGTFRLNLQSIVANNKCGTCRSDGYGMWALYDNSGDAPSTGASWGPGSDWLLHAGGTGF